MSLLHVTTLSASVIGGGHVLGSKLLQSDDSREKLRIVCYIFVMFHFMSIQTSREESPSVPQRHLWATRS